MESVNQINLNIDILILGAGPGGLGCFYGLNESDFEGSVLLLEMGKPLSERERYDSFDAANGQGGAGLFSDGKFSFYPSGTELWNLSDKINLQFSYQILKDLMSDLEQFPEWPQQKQENFIEKENNGPGGFFLKEYKSFYLSLEKRIQIINKMCVIKNIQKNNKQIQYYKKLLEVDFEKKIGIVQDTIKGELIKIQFKKLVLSGGRFHQLFLKKDLQKNFKRYEFGIRLEGENKYFENLKRNEQLIDPKWISNQNEQIQIRTFCFCKDGEVIKTNYENLECFSGRGDCIPTGKTNLGLNIRIKNQDLIDFEQILNCKQFQFKLSERNEKMVQKLGEKNSILCNLAIDLFLNQFDLKLFENQINVLGPTIEGIGFYPEIDMNLQSIQYSFVFVAGDSSGIFRGIIPSILSGIYIAQQIKKEKKLFIVEIN